MNQSDTQLTEEDRATEAFLGAPGSIGIVLRDGEREATAYVNRHKDGRDLADVFSEAHRLQPDADPGELFGLVTYTLSNWGDGRYSIGLSPLPGLSRVIVCDPERGTVSAFVPGQAGAIETVALADFTGTDQLDPDFAAFWREDAQTVSVGAGA